MKKYEINYPTLAIALDSHYRTSELKDFAAIICPKVPTLKADRVKAIVNTMFNDLYGVFKQLLPPAQQAISETVHTWGRYSTE